MFAIHSSSGTMANARLTLESLGAKSKTEPKWVRFAAGGAASCTAEICTLWIDTVKVRMQLAGQGGAAAAASGAGAISGPAPSLGAFGTFRSIVRAEGIGGLYKGLAAALLRQASYSSLRVGIYEPIKQVISRGNGTPSYFEKVLAGGSSGALGICLANPTELIKVRMQADKTGTRYAGVFHALKTIVQTEGARGLGAGVVPNMHRAFIVNAMELGTYDEAKTRLVRDYQFRADSVVTHTISSFVAGFFATVGCNPVDTIKNRLMNQPAGGSGRLYDGMIDCAIKTVRQEGPLALYKGFIPQWARLGPWCCVMFVTFEQYKLALRNVWEE